MKKFCSGLANLLHAFMKGAGFLLGQIGKGWNALRNAFGRLLKALGVGLVARREMKGYVFLLPWLIGFVLFFAVPLVQSVWYSWHDVKVSANGLKMTWVGWKNYAYIFQSDTVFIEQLTNFFSLPLAGP